MQKVRLINKTALNNNRFQTFLYSTLFAISDLKLIGLQLILQKLDNFIPNKTRIDFVNTGLTPSMVKIKSLF